MDQHLVFWADGTVYERPAGRLGWDATIQDIANGEFYDLGKVFRIDLSAGKSEDVTKAAAEAVFERVRDGGVCRSRDLRAWLEEHCGIGPVSRIPEAA